MPLLTPDGKPYRTSGTSRQYNPGSSSHKLFDLWDQAAIMQGGTPVYYYEVFIPTGEIDTDYFEARGKIFSNHGIEIWSSYDPQASQNFMNVFGMDSLNEISLECNANSLIKVIGHMPKIGSRIFTPHLGENWELIQINHGEFKMWGALRVQLICRQFQESVTTVGGKVTEKNPNIPRAI